MAPILATHKGIIVSDLHIGGGGPGDDFLPLEKTFLRLLSYADLHNFPLILNGDIFEFWQFSAKEIVRAHGAVFSALKAFRERGMVHLIAGNHDAEIAVFAPLLGHLVFEHLVVDAGGLMLYVEHGHRFDSLNRNPGWWQRSLSKLAGKLERIHPNIDNIPRYSAARDGFKGDPYWEAARGILENSPYDVVVFGHTHQEGEEAMKVSIRGDGKVVKRYINSGSWTGKRGMAVVFDKNRVYLAPNVKRKGSPL